MREDLINLYEVQKIDILIYNLERQRDQSPLQLRQWESTKQRLHQELETVTQQMTDLHSQQLTVRSQVDEEVVKIRKWESRLNEIRQTREFQALSREIEGAKRANKALEDKLHSLQQEKGNLELSQQSLQEKLADVTEKLAQEGVQVSSAQQQLEVNLTNYQQRRSTLIGLIPKALLRKYDTIRQRRQGVGMALISQGCCGACNMHCPPQMFIVLQRGNTVEQCHSCHRLLLWEGMLPPSNENGTHEDIGPVQEATA